jgi:hypothetical protein
MGKLPEERFKFFASLAKQRGIFCDSCLRLHEHLRDLAGLFKKHIWSEKTRLGPRRSPTRETTRTPLKLTKLGCKRTDRYDCSDAEKERKEERQKSNESTAGGRPMLVLIAPRREGKRALAGRRVDPQKHLRVGVRCGGGRPPRADAHPKGAFERRRPRREGQANRRIVREFKPFRDSRSLRSPGGTGRKPLGRNGVDEDFGDPFGGEAASKTTARKEGAPQRADRHEARREKEAPKRCRGTHRAGGSKR